MLMNNIHGESLPNFFDKDSIHEALKDAVIDDAARLRRNMAMAGKNSLQFSSDFLVSALSSIDGHCLNGPQDDPEDYEIIIKLMDSQAQWGIWGLKPSGMDNDPISLPLGVYYDYKQTVDVNFRFGIKPDEGFIRTSDRSYLCGSEFYKQEPDSEDLAYIRILLQEGIAHLNIGE
jgi:hypothetical protein